MCVWGRGATQMCTALPQPTLRRTTQTPPVSLQLGFFTDFATLMAISESPRPLLAAASPAIWDETTGRSEQ